MGGSSIEYMITALEAADVSDPDQSECSARTLRSFLTQISRQMFRAVCPREVETTGNVDQEWRSATSQSNLDRLLEALI